MLAELLLAAVALGHPLEIGPTGFGVGVTGGGACSTVDTVTNTNPSGAGSFWEAVDDGESDRCIRFAVSGYIDIPAGSTLTITGSNLTIDCASAPKPGVFFRGLIAVGDDDFIGPPPANHHWRHCRFGRGGEAPGSPFVIESLDGGWCDHCTFIYGADQGGSVFPIPGPPAFTGTPLAQGLLFSDNLWAHQLGCENTVGWNPTWPDGCEQDPGGPTDPHHLNSLMGGTIYGVSILRSFFGFSAERNPTIIVGPGAGIHGPPTGTGRAEKIQSWHHYTGISAFYALGAWEQNYDLLDNVYTAPRAVRVEDGGCLAGAVEGCDGNIMKIYCRGNVEGATLGSLTSPDANQDAICGAYGGPLSASPQHVAPARQVPHQAVTGDALDVVALVAAGAGAILPCRSPLEERAIQEALAGVQRVITKDEREVGGWPDLSASASCSGFVNKPVVASNSTGSGATNTQIDWDAICTDPDSKPFARYYRIVTQPSQGVVVIDPETGDGNFSATGVAPASYNFTYACQDGYSESIATTQVSVTP